MTRSRSFQNAHFFDEEASDHQRVHAELKNVRIASSRVHDGFAAQIERRVHDDGHARALSEFIDQPPVERIDSFSTVCGRACRPRV